MKKSIFFTLSILTLLALGLAFYVPGSLAARGSSHSNAAQVSSSASADDKVSKSAGQVEVEKHNGQDDAQPTLEATREAHENEMENEKAEIEDNEADEANEVEFTGTVQSMGANSWMIDGRTVLVSTGTEISGTIGVRDAVKVEGSLNADGKLSAREIKKVDATIESGDDNGASAGLSDDKGGATNISDDNSATSTTDDRSGKGRGSDDGGGHH
jgi:hypothetical protein